MALLYKLIILLDNKIIRSRQKQNKIIITFLSPDEKYPLHHSFARGPHLWRLEIKKKKKTIVI